MTTILNTAALGAVLVLAAGCANSMFDSGTTASMTRSAPSSEQMAMAGGATIGEAPKPHSDAQFMQDAARGDSVELRMARLALERATNPQVREFAQRMLDDHTGSTAKLASIAATEQATLAAAPGQNGQRVLQQLATLQGADFDRAYMQVQVTAHQQMAALMESEIENGTDPRLTAFAVAVLPTVQSHLQMAQQILATLVPAP